LKIGIAFGDEKIQEKARSLIKRASEHIESCYDPERKVYTHAVDSDHLDASTLQLILMNYLDPASQRAKDHLTALEKELKTPEGLIYSYLHTYVYANSKLTFLICAFWYVETLAVVGRIEEAQEKLKKLLSFVNHLILFSD